MMRVAWRLVKSYWTSEEKWSAWRLILAVLILNLGTVYISVQINEWNNAFYSALQSFNRGELFRQVGIFCVLVSLAIAMSVYALYLKQMLQIRWRDWLTRRYLSAWLADRAYYRLELSNTTDNPDQRISEDLNQFTAYFLSLSVALITSVVSLVSFLVVLWRLSGPMAIPLGPLGTMQVPAYLVWAALLYAGVGTWLVIKIGRPLVPLNVAQQRAEADFRFSLVRFRENAESVALYSGEPAELNIFHERFRSVFVNFRHIMKRQRSLTCFTLGYTQAAAIFPLVVVSPRYFWKQIGWGGLMQVVNAFSFVQNSLSFIINSYTDIAAWQAVTQRLNDFEEGLLAIRKSYRAPRQILVRRVDVGVAVKAVDLDLPDGTPLLRGVGFACLCGEALLISGPAGIGKSTLLRAVAGIWPFGRGEIRLGKGRILFVPQQPYLPLGTLVDTLLYPSGDSGRCPASVLAAVLQEVGLGMLTAKLDVVDNWSRRLSLGEQQRLAFARILLTKPELLFMDEATSAVDEHSEAELYGLLRRASWRPTVVSVGHRNTLRTLHEHILDVSAFCPRRSHRDRSEAYFSAAPFVVPPLTAAFDACENHEPTTIAGRLQTGA